jgi:DNA polymerase-1
MLNDVNLHLVEDFKDATEFMTWLNQTTADRIAVDVESEGLDQAIHKVRLIQFGDKRDGWAIPFERWSGLAFEAVDRIAKRGGRFVGHNVRFDVGMLRKHGLMIPEHLCDDSMMMSHLIDSTVSIGLKQQTARHIDPRAASAQAQLDSIMRSGGWNWATVPIASTGPVAAYWTYAALDVVLTSHLWDHHAPVVFAESPRAYDLETAIGFLASRMERKGTLIDRQYTEEKDAEFIALYAELTQRAHDEFGIDAGSKDQIVEVLLRDGVHLTKRTPTGAYSLDKDVLPKIDHPLARLIVQRKKVEKLHSTYLRRFLEYSTFDGRLHPNINTLGFSESSLGQFGVVTSRMSMQSPNLQQLPRGGDPLAGVIRNCIVAKDGHTLIMCDYDQIELRLMAHLSQDPDLIAAFGQGGDFFTILSRKIYKDETLTKSDPRRSLTKAYVYATLYGAGNDRLATTTGVPLAEVEQLAADFAAAYPLVPVFQQAVQQKARERFQAEGQTYVRSPLTGRKLIGQPGKEYKLVNYLIQGMAAEIMKTKALEIDAVELSDGTSLGDLLVLFVHDEYILEVPDELVDEVCRMLNEVVNDDKLLTVPLTAGLATSKKWGTKRDYELTN